MLTAAFLPALAQDKQAPPAEDADPFARAAKGAGEPSLSRILHDAGYGKTAVVQGGELADSVKGYTGYFAAVDPKKPVRITVLAAYGVLKTTQGGWYKANPKTTEEAADRQVMWHIDGPHNKQMNPPLTEGSTTTFEPKENSFGLWIASEAFPGEYIYTEDDRQKAIARLGKKLRKARVYSAVKNDGTPVKDALCIGFEYSTNDDCQEIVALVENLRPITKAD